MSTPPSAPVDPFVALQTTVIRTTFALLYDREPATRADAERLSFTTVDGETVSGVPAARRELVAALAKDPDGFSRWLSHTDRIKFLTSLAQAMGDELRSELQAQGGERLLTVLLSADGVRARELSLYRDTPRSSVIDLRDRVDVSSSAPSRSEV